MIFDPYTGEIKTSATDEILLLNSTISQKQLDDVKKSRRDWYFTAEEAFKYGMVDEIE